MSSSDMELVPINSQKHDPAWRHCQMFRIGEKVQLKCVYCGKFFKGGGIHRIKEHLAGHKGNAATCLSVPHDVRELMQQSLDGLEARRRKKQKITEEIANVDNQNLVVTDAMIPSGDQYDGGVNLQLQGISDLETVEPSSNMLLIQEETTKSVGVEKKKRGRKPKVSTGAINPISYADAAIVFNNGTGMKMANDQILMAIGRFLYDIGAPLDAVNSAYFKPMVDAIASGGPGVSPPSYHDIRGWILKNSAEEVQNGIDKVMVGLGRTGCSILVDEWNTEKGKTFLSFIVYCPEGTFFLKSADASSAIENPDKLYELLRQVVEEVGVSHVLQVVMNGEEERYIDVGKRLMDAFPTLYWITCSARCLDTILEDFTKLEWINNIILQAKSITRFIYNHSTVLNLMKQYTSGNDIVDVGPTCNATSFTTLSRMVGLKDFLQAMFTNQEWIDSPCARKQEGEAILDIITDPSFWSSCALVSKLTTPLLRVLRMVTSEKRPVMGYIFAGMYRVKEIIKKELVDRREYMVYWNIIDQRWKQQWDYPLHAAGFYLNPKYFYNNEGDMHTMIQSGMFDCIERLVADTDVQDKIIKELNLYKNASGDFGRNLAVRARDTLLPAEWWSTYGGSCPHLARLAVRILSQTCSSSWSTGTQIPFEKVHSAKNCLEHQRLRDLAFVQYNLRLKTGFEKKGLSILNQRSSLHGINTAEDWISGKDEYFNNPDSVWSAVDQVSTNSMSFFASDFDTEELGAEFNDHEILDSVRDKKEGKE